MPKALAALPPAICGNRRGALDIGPSFGGCSSQGIWDYFAPHREAREEFAAKPDFVRQVMADGAVKARKAATITMDLVRVKVGLIY
ncbi:MAG: hypothetical protein LBO05_03280 [Deltaproteobacteria bacterium]|nr:hypothetical protein [Deltaproteobacteria bacterium]